MCCSWGFLVHRSINQLAVYQLPVAMRPFFYEHMAYLVKHSVRPDQRRNFDSKEAPKHFIDAEAYGDSALWTMPYSWNKAVELYAADSLEKYGYAPYWIMVMKEKLTDVFKAEQADSILYYAADLAHYVGDINVPLHTTLNYDGQLTGQRGLHALWESTIPEMEINQYQLYNRHRARYYNNPERAIWKAARNAYALLPTIFEIEKSVSKAFTDSTKYRIQMRNGREVKSYSSAFARAYGKQLSPTINQQLLASANLITDLWYTCWVDAGKPNLNRLLKNTGTDDLKNQMKQEWKWYRNNQLIKENKLMARNSSDE